MINYNTTDIADIIDIIVEMQGVTAEEIARQMYKRFPALSEDRLYHAMALAADESRRRADAFMQEADEIRRYQASRRKGEEQAP